MKVTFFVRCLKATKRSAGRPNSPTTSTALARSTAQVAQLAAAFNAPCNIDKKPIGINHKYKTILLQILRTSPYYTLHNRWNHFFSIELYYKFCI